MHDSAIAVLDPDGVPIFACSLERLSRVKQDGRWPSELLRDLPTAEFAAIGIGSLSRSDAAELGRQKGLQNWPWRKKSGAPVEPLLYPDEWHRRIGGLPKPQHWFDHHHCHAASAYYLTDFTDSLILTCDAGAYQCPWHAAAFHAHGDEVGLIAGVSFDHYMSPAHIYTLVTTLLKLRPNRHEGKVTGLAARSRITDLELAKFEELAWPMVEDLGQLLRWDSALDLTNAPTIAVNEFTAAAWRGKLGELSDTQLAASAQAIAEREALKFVDHVRGLTNHAFENICLAGGLFANVRINQKVIAHGFKRGFVAPPMTDDGVALGAAQLAYARHRGHAPKRHRTTMYLGPTIDTATAVEASAEADLRSTQPADLPRVVAELLANGKVVAVARGAMEFGPRALGHRTILAPAVDASINDALNSQLRRTEYMPFAPMVLAEDADELFEGVDRIADSARFMTVTANATAKLIDTAPAVVHVDGTARPQILAPGDDPFCEQVLRYYGELTGVHALVNTSFNVHEEPITCSAEDALRGFAQTGLDYLCLGDTLIARADNLEALAEFARERPNPEHAPGQLSAGLALSRWMAEERENAADRMSQLVEDLEWHQTKLAEATTTIASTETFNKELADESRRVFDEKNRLAEEIVMLSSKNQELLEEIRRLSTLDSDKDPRMTDIVSERDARRLCSAEAKERIRAPGVGKLSRLGRRLGVLRDAPSSDA